MPHITTKKLFNAQMNKILKRYLHSKREVQDVYIASTARTPLGSMGGQLKVRFLNINKAKDKAIRAGERKGSPPMF